MPWRASPADASARPKTLPPGISTGITPNCRTCRGNPYLGWSQNRPTVSCRLTAVGPHAGAARDSNKGNNHEGAYDEGARPGLRVAGSVGSYLDRFVARE